MFARRPLFDPRRDEVYSLFTQYFGNPYMVKQKDEQGYSFYICKIHTFLVLEFKYLIAVVVRDNVLPGTMIRLEKLPWVSFQTRILKTEMPSVSSHSYEPRNMPGLDVSIKLVKRDEKSYNYVTDRYPIVVSLLAKDPNNKEYTDSGTVCTALEMYNTVVTFR